MPKDNGHLGSGQLGSGQLRTGHAAQGHATAIRECDLKICELCGWLNLDSNLECFVCGWHGRFERDPHVVHAALELALREYGRVEIQHLTDPCTYHKASVGSPLGRLAAWVRSLVVRFRHD